MGWAAIVLPICLSPDSSDDATGHLCGLCQDDWQLPAEAFEPRPEPDDDQLSDEVSEDNDEEHRAGVVIHGSGGGAMFEMSAVCNGGATPATGDDAITNHWGEATLHQATLRPVERVAGGVSYPGPRDTWGASPLLRNTKYTKMHHCEKEKFKNLLPKGGLQECFPGPRCRSRRAW